MTQTTMTVAVDIVVFGYNPGQSSLRVLLIERGVEPFKGRLALPGGRVELDETTEEAAKRELAEETGIEPAYLEQLYTFSQIDRDPRGRVVSVAYFALVPMAEFKPVAGTDAAAADWYEYDEVKNLAFDHGEIVRVALARLRGKIVYAPLGFDLLPKTFTIPELCQLYEVVLNRKLEPANFRRKILRMGVLVEVGQRETGYRPATTYRFDEAAYHRLAKQGWVFEL